MFRYKNTFNFGRREPSTATMTTLLIAILAFSANTQATIALSDFDGGAGDFDGWTGLSCVNPGICSLASSPLGLSHFTTEGVNNRGYIEGTNPNSSSAARALARAKFLNELA